MLEQLGLKIKEERLRKNLNIDELAKIIETSEIAVKLWEAGKMAPRISQLIKLSKFFNISIDDLLGI